MYLYITELSLCQPKEMQQQFRSFKEIHMHLLHFLDSHVIKPVLLHYCLCDFW